MNCPSVDCQGTIAVLYVYDEDDKETVHRFPCNECQGTYRRNLMPEMRNNVPCPTPGCPGSRCDIIVTDDNGTWIEQRSEPCNVCGR